MTGPNPRSALGALSLAAAMAVTLAAPLPAFAQSTATDEAGESQLDMSIERFFDSHGITTEVQTLSLGQLAAIHALVSDSGSTTKEQIEAIIADN
ncbi:hypothetical protein [uncultured Jannaschia sp.]|uniref:hypothetical protein n=1 Tax=uncultured Jannaschia sp. TaxID=293347 RepID=UPI0026296CA6|nr:hypothetical protein [uncultured Jannaschia sp.]